MRSESPRGWVEAALGDLVSVEHGYAFKSEFFCDPDDGVPIVVGVGNFEYSGGFRFQSTQVKGYSGEFPDRFGLRPGDILLVMTCQTQGGEILGIPGRIPDDGHLYLHNQRLGRVVVRDADRFDADFAYWLFLDPDFNQHLCRTASGSKILHTAPSRIEAFPVTLPPIEEQRRVANVLGALNDKIESNRRLGALADGIVATLFRARFVDFLGVEEFEDTEIGRIPSGWRAGGLTDLGRFVNGRAFTKHANDQGRPILRIRELNSGIDESTPYSDVDAADEHVARDGDVLFAWSGSLGVYRWSGPEALINQHIFKVIPDGYPPWFVYQWICRHLAEFRAIARDKATTMGHIQRRHLSEAAVPLPQDKVIAAVADTLDPMDEQRVVLAAEARTLGALRDALLHKLISGEIRVPVTDDPDEVIGSVAEALAAGRS
jgi:type I restriction enzyme S subunit